MSEDKDALIAHYESTRAHFLEAIAGLSPSRLIEPSVDGWSVKDHILHLATWDDIRASEVERISKGFDSAWRMTDEQDEALNEMAYEIRRNLSLEQARAEFEDSRARLLAAIRSSTDRGLDGSLYAAAGLKSGHEEEHIGWIRGVADAVGDLGLQRRRRWRRGFARFRRRGHVRGRPATGC